MNKYFKVKIKTCRDRNFWYVHKIGQIILVKEVSWPSAYFEAKNESSVLRWDVERIAKSK